MSFGRVKGGASAMTVEQLLRIYNPGGTVTAEVWAAEQAKALKPGDLLFFLKPVNEAIHHATAAELASQPVNPYELAVILTSKSGSLTCALIGSDTYEVQMVEAMLVQHAHLAQFGDRSLFVLAARAQQDLAPKSLAALSAFESKYGASGWRLKQDTELPESVLYLFAVFGLNLKPFVTGNFLSIEQIYHGIRFSETRVNDDNIPDLRPYFMGLPGPNPSVVDLRNLVGSAEPATADKTEEVAKRESLVAREPEPDRVSQKPEFVKESAAVSGSDQEESVPIYKDATGPGAEPQQEEAAVAKAESQAVDKASEVSDKQTAEPPAATAPTSGAFVQPPEMAAPVAEAKVETEPRQDREEKTPAPPAVEPEVAEAPPINMKPLRAQFVQPRQSLDAIQPNEALLSSPMLESSRTSPSVQSQPGPGITNSQVDDHITRACARLQSVTHQIQGTLKHKANELSHKLKSGTLRREKDLRDLCARNESRLELVTQTNRTRVSEETDAARRQLKKILDSSCASIDEKQQAAQSALKDSCQQLRTKTETQTGHLLNSFGELTKTRQGALRTMADKHAQSAGQFAKEVLMQTKANGERVVGRTQTKGQELTESLDVRSKKWLSELDDLGQRADAIPAQVLSGFNGTVMATMQSARTELNQTSASLLNEMRGARLTELAQVMRTRAADAQDRLLADLEAGNEERFARIGQTIMSYRQTFADMVEESTFVQEAFEKRELARLQDTIGSTEQAVSDRLDETRRQCKRMDDQIAELGRAIDGLAGSENLQDNQQITNECRSFGARAEKRTAELLDELSRSVEKQLAGLQQEQEQAHKVVAERTDELVLKLSDTSRQCLAAAQSAIAEALVAIKRELPMDEISGGAS